MSYSEDIKKSLVESGKLDHEQVGNWFHMFDSMVKQTKIKDEHDIDTIWQMVEEFKTRYRSQVHVTQNESLFHVLDEALHEYAYEILMPNFKG